MFIPCMQQTLTTQTTLELLGNFDQINVLTCDLLNWAIIEHHTQLDSVCGYYNTTHIADVFECFICKNSESISKWASHGDIINQTDNTQSESYRCDYQCR